MEFIKMSSFPIKVSIIIAVYNAGDLIARMLDSIFAQTEQEFEVICVNNGSTDNGYSVALCEAYARKDSRVRVVVRKKPSAGDAFNHGLSLAKGKYCYMCDQDDILHPQFLEYCIWALETYSAEFLTFRYQDFHEPLPTFSSLPVDFSTIPHLVSDQSLREVSPKKYVLAHKIPADKWGQFVTTLLAKECYFTGGSSAYRGFKLLKKATRWVVSEAILYFYDNGNPNSMTQKGVSLQFLRSLWSDMQKIFELYEDERLIGDPIGLWEGQCDGCIIKIWPVILTYIKRGKYSTRKERYQLFSDILYDFIFKKQVSFRWVWRYSKRKHRLIYVWLLLRFKFWAIMKRLH